MINVVTPVDQAAALAAYLRWINDNVGPCNRTKFGTFQGEHWLIIATLNCIKIYIDDPALEVMFKLACL